MTSQNQDERCIHLVNLDAGDDAIVVEHLLHDCVISCVHARTAYTFDALHLDKGLAIMAVLKKRLFEQNGARDVVTQPYDCICM
jgi:hypothetical protein